VRRTRPRWDLERQVRLAAGSLVLAAVLAGVVVPPVTWLAALVGAGLAVAALTNTCLLGMLLTKLPYNRGQRTTVGTVVAALSAGRG
jgi:Flp pilus assembly protein TadB